MEDLQHGNDGGALKLMSLHIGGMKIEDGAVLAPMAGVTDAPFRLLCHEQGAALTVTEMISAKGTLCAPKDNRAQRDLLWTMPDSGPTALQIFGAEPNVMAEAAQHILSQHEFCMVDINMGCPAPKIVREGGGSALMREPALAARIIEAAVRAVAVPVTVKMRLGWDESSRNALAFARMVEQSGAQAVTVHGRTRSQFYAEEADWGAIGEIKAALRIPVLGNGDISSAQEAIKRMRESGCDGVAIGRGAMGNPWIFDEFAELRRGNAAIPRGLAQRMETAARHLRMMVAWKGEHAAVPEMRKHIGWYIKGLPGAARIREAVNHMMTMQQMLDCLCQVSMDAEHC